MFLLSRLWAKILFDYSASHSFVAASCVNALGLEVETLERPLHVSSLLGIRVRVDKICQDCELEIPRILLMVDLRVMDISEFDVILGMDWLTAHRVVIDCDRMRITTYTQDGICVIFQGDKHGSLPQTVHDSRWSRQLMGCVTPQIPECPLTTRQPAEIYMSHVMRPIHVQKWPLGPTHPTQKCIFYTK